MVTEVELYDEPTNASSAFTPDSSLTSRVFLLGAGFSKPAGLPDEARRVYAAASMPEASPLHNSGIWHVRLYADGQLEADAYILNRLPKIY